MTTARRDAPHSMHLPLWKRLPPATREKWLRRFFQFGVLLKGLDGVLETIGGVVFLLASRSLLNEWVIRLTRPELLEDPDDLVANALRHAFSHLSAGGKLFGSLYLLVHGAIKIFLAICLLRGKRWSFPAAMGLLVAFIAYQVYRLNVHFSWTLFVLTILDLVIIFLIRHEYLRFKQERKKPD